jgi:hypothetical protein
MPAELAGLRACTSLTDTVQVIKDWEAAGSAKPEIGVSDDRNASAPHVVS